MVWCWAAFARPGGVEKRAAKGRKRRTRFVRPQPPDADRFGAGIDLTMQVRSTPLERPFNIVLIRRREARTVGARRARGVTP